eukprot:scaffold5723_cov38-Prasinocladus_malaysianus.AAC.1
MEQSLSACLLSFGGFGEPQTDYDLIGVGVIPCKRCDPPAVKPDSQGVGGQVAQGHGGQRDAWEYPLGRGVLSQGRSPGQHLPVQKAEHECTGHQHTRTDSHGLHLQPLRHGCGGLGSHHRAELQAQKLRHGADPAQLPVPHQHQHLDHRGIVENHQDQVGPAAPWPPQHANESGEDDWHQQPGLRGGGGRVRDLARVPGVQLPGQGEGHHDGRDAVVPEGGVGHIAEVRLAVHRTDEDKLVVQRGAWHEPIQLHLGGLLQNAP